MVYTLVYMMRIVMSCTTVGVNDDNDNSDINNIVNYIFIYCKVN